MEILYNLSKPIDIRRPWRKICGDCVEILQNLLTNKTRYATDPKCGGKVERKEFEKVLDNRTQTLYIIKCQEGKRKRRPHRRATAQIGDA